MSAVEKASAFWNIIKESYALASEARFDVDDDDQPEKGEDKEEMEGDRE